MCDLKKSWACLQLHVPPFPRSCVYPDSLTTIPTSSFQKNLITAPQGQARVWSGGMSELPSFSQRRDSHRTLYSQRFLLLPCNSHSNPYPKVLERFGLLQRQTKHLQNIPPGHAKHPRLPQATFLQLLLISAHGSLFFLKNSIEWRKGKS